MCFKNSVLFAVVLLVSGIGWAQKKADELSAEYGLNTVESVVDEFHKLTGEIQKLLGKQAWTDMQVEALEALAQRNFTHFDPLVRETSCELRALIGLHLVQQLESGHALSQDEEDLAVLIFILSHALTTHYGSDGFGIGDENSEAQLLSFLHAHHLAFGNNKVQKLIKKLEQAVANGSVRFARELAQQLGNEALYNLFLNQCVFDAPERRRPVLSCLGICHLGLEFAAARGILFVVRTRLAAESQGASSGTVVVIYRHDGQRFVPVDPRSVAPQTPVLVADAVATRFEDGNQIPPDAAAIQSYVEQLDLRIAWLSGGAAHPQFAGHNAEVELGGASGVNQIVDGLPVWVEMARNIGTASDNRRAQFIDHTYLTTWGEARRYDGRRGAVHHEPVVLSVGLYYPVPVIVARPALTFTDIIMPAAAEFLTASGVAGVIRRAGSRHR